MRVLTYLESRFAIPPSTFNPYTLYLGKRRTVIIGPSPRVDLSIIDTGGLSIGRISNGVKPSTDLFQTFGRLVQKNVIPIDANQAIQYCSGEDLELAEERVVRASDGFVMVTFWNLPLACGLLRGTTLVNQVPRRIRLKSLTC